MHAVATDLLYNSEELFTAARIDSADLASRPLSTAELDVNLRDSVGETALHIGAESGSASVTELLLARPDIEVNLAVTGMGYARGHTALDLAARTGRTRIMEMLLKRPDVQVSTDVRYVSD